MAKTFDPKCWELAAHFLSDVPGSTEDHREDLARDLQMTAEEFCICMTCCPLCAACSGFIGAECDGTCAHAAEGN